jgi:peroxiredoxin Q/BCP
MKVTAKKKTSGTRNPAAVAVGERVEKLKLPSTAGAEFNLAKLRGRHVVMYFYPKDNTPGCTLEGQDFRRLYTKFQKLGCEIVGISRDTLRAHETFKKKCEFPFELLSDEDESVCRQFGVIQLKKLYGREFQGIERSTFLIDKKGILKAEWRKVKVAGHAQVVLEAVEEL